MVFESVEQRGGDDHLGVDACRIQAPQLGFQASTRGGSHVSVKTVLVLAARADALAGLTGLAAGGWRLAAGGGRRANLMLNFFSLWPLGEGELPSLATDALGPARSQSIFSFLN